MASGSWSDPHEASVSDSNLPFNTIEADLRDIDEDFTAGRMNAFGVAATHDEIMKEMKKVGELELQIFFRTTEQMKAAAEDESTISRVLQEFSTTNKVAEDMERMPASPEHPVSGHSRSTTRDYEDSTNASFVNQSSPSAKAKGDIGEESGSGAPPEATPSRPETSGESMIKKTDKTFDEIAKLFRAKEASMRTIGENLRQISQHVSTVNELAQKAHSGAFTQY